ncbi:MAG: site-specific integrase [Rhodospirillales bacterium]|nr:site-specific integrase [Rhodospirillales bacterium]
MTNPPSISPLRQRMIEDMTARSLGRQTQRGHILACKRFAAYLKRSPDTATAEDVRLFQLHLMESGHSIQNRNRTMTGLRFLLRVTMRRLDLAAEIYHMKEPQRIPQILSADEAKRLLTMAANPQVRMLFSIGYGAGLQVRPCGNASGSNRSSYTSSWSDHLRWRVLGGFSQRRSRS